jgi:hypothetical protein
MNISRLVHYKMLVIFFLVFSPDLRNVFQRLPNLTYKNIFLIKTPYHDISKLIFQKKDFDKLVKPIIVFYNFCHKLLLIISKTSLQIINPVLRQRKTSIFLVLSTCSMTSRTAPFLRRFYEVVEIDFISGLESFGHVGRPINFIT